VLRALTEQAEQGGGRVVRLSLARTAAWLTGGIERAPGEDEDAGAAYGGARTWLAERDSRLGRLRYALPPVSFEGGPGDWARPPGPWGADEPRWD
jgi:hypothetical protein